VRTRFELVLRSRGVRPIDVARATAYSRQHLLRLREGLPVSARFRTAALDALRHLTHSPLAAEEVFEPEGIRVADLLEEPRGQRTSARGRVQAATNIRALVKSVVALEDDAVAEWLARIYETRRAHTEAATRDLTDVAEALLDVLPARASALYGAAVRLTELLPSSPTLLVAALRGYAQKGRANALRMLGRYREALDVLNDAEQHFLDARYCAVDIGNTRYTRATILWKMEKWTMAAQAVVQARQIFDAEHDQNGVLRARMVEGAILADQGDLEKAKAIFVALRKQVEARRDRETLARVWMNLAAIDLRRGDAFATRHWLDRAARAFRALHMPTEVTRTRWCAGKLAFLERDRARGFRLLRTAMDEFARFGMHADAGFAGLDLLEELLRDPAQRRDAERLARSLADVFLRADISVSAAKALSYLEEAVVSRTAAPPLVSYVKAYMRRASVFPDAAFRPPVAMGPV
jgi:tetratricopeptide (TPR) repeat protein